MNLTKTVNALRGGSGKPSHFEDMFLATLEDVTATVEKKRWYLQNGNLEKTLNNLAEVFYPMAGTWLHTTHTYEEWKNLLDLWIKAVSGVSAGYDPAYYYVSVDAFATRMTSLTINLYKRSETTGTDRPEAVFRLSHVKHHTKNNT